MSVLINNEDRKKYRKKLRSNMPKPERVLWYYLRNKQIEGIKFRRQCSIGPYIVDFYSFEKKLVIEVDGNSHYESDEAERYDRRRNEFIESKGIKIIRFTNAEVMGNMEGCYDVLLKELKSDPHDTPLNPPC